MNAYRAIGLGAIAAGFWAVPAASEVIYDNGGPTGNSQLSDSTTDYAYADDFILLEGANIITDIHWWGLYASNGSPQAEDFFTITIYGDDGGSLGTPVFTVSPTSVGRTDTGLDNAGGYDFYAYSIDIEALELVAGSTYWISILNDTSVDPNDSWYWATTGEDGNAWLNGTLPSNHDLAFNLTNDNLATVIPEPATMTLLGLGLAGVVLRRRLG